ncbi:MAG: S9 family peptidase, partial [Marinilabiliales bacterium]
MLNQIKLIDMKKKLLIFIVTISIFMTSCVQNVDHFNYPVAKKVDTVDVYFGHEVADPYRWLEDDNSEETAKWVAEENKITFNYLNKIPFRQALEDRLTEIWNYPKYGVPFKKGEKYFFFKNDGIQNQSVLYISNDLNEEAQVLLDPNKLSDDGTVALAGLGFSKDGKYLAYSTASGGSDWNEIYVMEVQSGKMLDDHIQWVKFSGISWWKDGFFYSSYDKPKDDDVLSGQNQFHKIYYHKLGNTQKEDMLIFQNDKEPLRNYYAYLNEDKTFLFGNETERTSGNSLYAATIDSLKDLKFELIAEGFDYEFGVVDVIDNNLLLKTNYKAPKSTIVYVDFNNPAM